jgi:hypothetical protein
MAMPADDEKSQNVNAARGMLEAGKIYIDPAAITPITHEHPTGFHRYVKRKNPDLSPLVGPLYRRIHQQEWALVTFTGMYPTDRRTEWRDVPEVEE